MLYGFMLLAVTGMLWGSFGVVINHLKSDKNAFFSCRALSEGIGSIVAWVLLPDFTDGSTTTHQKTIVLILLLISGEILKTTGLTYVQKAMSLGHKGQAWMISQSAFIIPLIAGVVIFSESLNTLHTIGVIICVCSIIFLGQPENEECAQQTMSASSYRLAILAFICFGTQQTIYTLPSHLNLSPTLLSLRVPILLTASMIINGSIAVSRNAKISKKIIWPALILSSCSLSSMFLFYKGMDMLATVNMISLTFPITVGSCIASFAIYSHLWLKESFHFKHAICLSGILGSLACFAMT